MSLKKVFSTIAAAAIAVGGLAIGASAASADEAVALVRAYAESNPDEEWKAHILPLREKQPVEEGEKLTPGTDEIITV